MLKGVFVLLFLPVLLCAQEWKRVESGVTVDLYDIFFVNKDIGWAVGDDSTIIKSTDGGRTWIRQASGISAHYNSIWFNDDKNGWIVGHTTTSPSQGTIIATSNGGMSWTEQYRVLKWFEDVQFTSSDTGYAVGKKGIGSIVKTTNGGKDWTILGEDIMAKYPSGGFQGVSFVSNNLGWVCGGEAFFDNHENELLLQTTDGGISWMQQDSPFRVGPLRDIQFADSLHGFAGGRGDGVRTLNGGNEWSKFQLSELTALSVVNSDIAYFASRNTVGPGLYISKEAGYNCRQMSIENYAGIFGLFALDTVYAWAVGANGSVWIKHTTTDVLANPTIPKILQCEIYPNPVSKGSTGGSQILIAAALRIEEVDLFVYNSIGRLQYVDCSYSFNNDELRIVLNVEGLPSDNYYLFLYDAKTHSVGAYGCLSVIN